jgi:transcriptional regulator with XRE-family HTH domain
MDDLRKRFGRLVAVHRKRSGLTQEALAEAADVSIDTIAKIEIGATGARFPVIQRLSKALDVDPAELFSTEVPGGVLNRGIFGQISMRLAQLNESQLLWAKNLLEAALPPIGSNVVSESRSPEARQPATGKRAKRKQRAR